MCRQSSKQDTGNLNEIREIVGDFSIERDKALSDATP